MAKNNSRRSHGPRPGPARRLVAFVDVDYAKSGRTTRIQRTKGPESGLAERVGIVWARADDTRVVGRGEQTHTRCVAAGQPRLHVAAGSPTDREMTARSDNVLVPASTMRVMNGSPASPMLLGAFLQALGVDQIDERRQWYAAWERVRSSTAPRAA